MKDYRIEQAAAGRNKGENSDASRTAEIRLRDGAEVFWLSVCVSAQCTLFFRTECSALALLEDDDGDPDIADWFEQHLLCEIGDFASYLRNPDREWHRAFMILLYLACGEPEAVRVFAAEIEEEYVGNVKGPACRRPV